MTEHIIERIGTCISFRVLFIIVINLSKVVGILLSSSPRESKKATAIKMVLPPAKPIYSVPHV